MKHVFAFLANGPIYIERFGRQQHRFHAVTVPEPNRGQALPAACIVASQWFRSVKRAVNSVQGYEAMHIIRKGQIQLLTKGDVVGQFRLVNRAFGLAA
jgi:hypothetical protein